MADTTFSQQMSDWLKSPGQKTFGDLEEVFKAKSFAVAFLILMAPAALPIPTGGITHVLEVITMLLALEMIFGRDQIWSPKSWQERSLGNVIEKNALPKLIRSIEWFEKKSSKRLSKELNNKIFLRIVGALVFIFALAAALALPFSGLDTLPALAVVILSLALILEDALLIVISVAVGVAGIIAEISLGAAALHLLNL